MTPQNQWSPNEHAIGHGQPLARRKPKRNRFMTAAILAMIAALLWSSISGMDVLERLLSNPDTIPESETAPAGEIPKLHPIVAAKKDELVAQTAKIGITILITDGMRTSEEQDRLYEQGRSKSGPIVTNVRGGESYHNYGLAIDFALRTVEDNSVVWDMEYDGNGNGKADWMEVVAIAKKLGFTWGGDWKNFRDYPHLQMDFGYSIADLKRGKRPPAKQK
ncbi:M15 family metallopeptidase [Paenibacillus gorillae]|uniref:M15 family metallopeptidase n=1 Tax=Paenibacillus gorillae TaxID=1243662 RepID=UPI0004AC90F2|nr:M15 family metallopeptidase [Paenibacillus gorillae]